MAVNQDFRDLFSALSATGAEFLVVGAHAVMFYTVPPYTKDIDLWVCTSNANARRVYNAIAAFGVPIHLLGRAELLASKRAAGRPQDLLDIERLERT